MSGRVCVIIPTKNRKDLLRQVISSVLAQTVPAEVRVMDDGSTDGTEQMVRAEFPQVHYHREEASRGPCFERNKAAELTAAEFLVTIDDDCVLASPRTLEQTIPLFDHPRIGAVSIPFINVLKEDRRVHTAAPVEDQPYVAFDYWAGMVAFRREVYQRIGGCRAFVFMLGEEADVSVRLLEAGYVLRLGTADPIEHHESPVRDSRRLHMLGPRNNVLYAWWNVPMPYFPAHIAATSLLALRHGLRVGRPLLAARGAAQGWLGCLQQLTRRRPVRPGVYRLARQLRRSGPQPLSAIEASLPEIAH